MTDILERLRFREFDETATLGELAAIDEIERLRATVIMLKREILTADSIVKIGNREMIVPSNVKAEIEYLREQVRELKREIIL